MSAILAAIMANLVPVVATGIAGFVGLGIHWLTKKIATKIGAEQFASELDSAATQAVLAIEQSIVDPLVKSGDWGKADSYAKALSAGLDTFKALMPGAADKLSKAGIADANAYMSTLLEAKIKQIQLTQAAGARVMAASIAVPIPDLTDAKTK
jgi:hypothetical protein